MHHRIIKAVLSAVFIWIAVGMMWAFQADFCKAGIYKYQKDGVWYYTDSPPVDMPQDSEQINGNGESGQPAELSDRVLLADFAARNPLEKAAAATVAVNSALGFGSGFFITADGYIITNKHVIRTTAPENRKVESYFSQGEDRIAEIEAGLIQEQKRMQNFQIRLQRLKKAADTESQVERRKIYIQDYQDNQKKLDEWRRSNNERLKKFETEKEHFETRRSSYSYSRSVADLSQSFTVILADNTELYARLVAVSADFDLALLKIDGFTTPALEPAATDSLVQGAPVYAIGNPARLHNSVTSGILSGFAQGGDIQTNAQIYPGNSGGPLVDEQGRVLGINTYKKLTYKFEGLGFAIPIQTALVEFAGHLKRQ